jgi:competence protein ComEA
VSEITRPQLAVYVAAAVAIALLGARYLRDTRASQPPDGRPVAVRVDGGAGSQGFAVVQVAGEVRRPGVYRVRAGQRVNDAVRMAGGATVRADLAGVNLAAKVEDGRQVIVPARAAGQAEAAGGGPAAGGSAGASGTGSAPLNLNTATEAQLDELDGVGPATARKIVAYRQQHGGFRSVSELDQVPGIGPKRLAALKDMLSV